jgi:hypothetical protein
MGMLLRAVDDRLDRPVAIKIIDPKFSGDGDFRARFERECKVLARMRHPNVVMIYFFDEFRGSPYFAMELVEGSNLEEYLLRSHRVDWRLAVRWMIQCCSGLSAASEQGIIHRDLKPANILLDSNNEIRIVDFGLAKSMGVSKQLTAAAMVVGTPHYMSPEQAKGFDLDWRSDLYSLGATFFHVLSGETLFDAPSAMEVVVKHIGEAPRPLCSVREGISEELGKLIDGLLSKHPEERGFDDYRGVSERLQGLLVPSPQAFSEAARTLTPGSVAVGGAGATLAPSAPPPAGETMAAPSSFLVGEVMASSLSEGPAVSANAATMVATMAPVSASVSAVPVSFPGEAYAWLEVEPGGAEEPSSGIPQLRDVALVSARLATFGTATSNAIFLPFSRRSKNPKRVAGEGGHGGFVWTPGGYQMRTLRHLSLREKGRGPVNECRLDGGAILGEGDFPIQPGMVVDLRSQYSLFLGGSRDGGLGVSFEIHDERTTRDLPVTWSVTLVHQRAILGSSPMAGVSLPGRNLPGEFLAFRAVPGGYLVEAICEGAKVNGMALSGSHKLEHRDRLEGPGFGYIFILAKEPRELWEG